MKIEDIKINGTTYVRETHDDGFTVEYIKYRGTTVTPEDEAKKILATVKTEELDKTDLGKAVKALLVNAGLI